MVLQEQGCSINAPALDFILVLDADGNPFQPACSAIPVTLIGCLCKFPGLVKFVEGNGIDLAGISSHG